MPIRPGGASHRAPERERALAERCCPASRRGHRAREAHRLSQSAQARKEIADPTPVKERGWQDALEAVYPLKSTFRDSRTATSRTSTRGRSSPLRIRNLELVATTFATARESAPIRSTSASPPRLRVGSPVCRRPGQLPRGPNRPSAVTSSSPHRARLLQADHQPHTTSGSTRACFSAGGHVEYGQETRTSAHASDDRRIHVDYVPHRPDRRRRTRAAQKAAAAAKEASNAPICCPESTSCNLTKAPWDSVNQGHERHTASPLGHDGRTDESQQSADRGTAVAKLKGAFMGSGTATAEATFRRTVRPDFDIA